MELIQLDDSLRTKALERLTTQTPKDITNKILTTLNSIISYEEKLNKDYSIHSYHLVGDNPADKIEEANRIISLAMVPLPLDQMHKALHKCTLVMVKPSQETPADVALRIRAIADGLSDFPADIFLHAVDHIAKTKTWFPSLAEYRMAGEYHFKKRKMLYEMMQNSIKRTNLIDFSFAKVQYK